jgi:hypothetical protein
MNFPSEIAFFDDNHSKIELIYEGNTEWFLFTFPESSGQCPVMGVTISPPWQRETLAGGNADDDCVYFLLFIVCQAAQLAVS